MEYFFHLVIKNYMNPLSKALSYRFSHHADNTKNSLRNLKSLAELNLLCEQAFH
ncbi:hypothetical protein ELAC_0894 [Estrella lausannensis]|uniref:Uncharacterized protein n=1 Tax=Estrella lausannensis TaxID=483423 RepID=A0A0H5DQA6_9BACT|nr:hypothetical protein ELAC_0894 [Estrella lausannensis]